MLKGKIVLETGFEIPIQIRERHMKHLVLHVNRISMWQHFLLWIERGKQIRRWKKNQRVLRKAIAKNTLPKNFKAKEAREVS